MSRWRTILILLFLAGPFAGCSDESLEDLGVETEARRLQRQCKDDKDRAACVRHLMVYGAAAELQKKVSFWEENCALDPPRVWACLRLGHYFRYTGRPREALHAWGRSCTAAFGKSPEHFDVCLAAGKLSRQQEEVEAARKFYGHACEHGHKQACVAAAKTLYYEGKVATAGKQLRSQCREQDLPAACIYLAGRLRILQKHAEANDLLAHACDKAPGQACVLLARQKYRGKGEDGHKQARQLFERACQAGEQEGCMQLGVQLEQAGRRKAAREYYRGGCERQHGESCLRYAGLLAADPAAKDAAMRAREQACANGLTQTCQTVAAQLRQAGRREEARLLLRAACEQGDNAGCLQLAKEFAEARDFAAAEAYLTRVCNRNDWRGCLRLASQYEAQGQQGRMASVFKRMCRMGSRSGCVALSKYHLERREYPAAESAVKELCYGGFLDACYPLMQVYAAQNLEAKVVEVGVRTCKLGFVGGCNALVPFAGHKQFGDEVTAFLGQSCRTLDIIPACAPLGRSLRSRGDRSAARKILQQTCDKGVPAACEEYGISLWQRGRSKDRKRAEELLAQACKQHGSGRACEHLGRFLNQAGRRRDADRYFAMACGLGLRQHCRQPAAAADKPGD